MSKFPLLKDLYFALWPCTSSTRFIEDYVVLLCHAILEYCIIQLLHQIQINESIASCFPLSPYMGADIFTYCLTINTDKLFKHLILSINHIVNTNGTFNNKSHILCWCILTRMPDKSSNIFVLHLSIYYLLVCRLVFSDQCITGVFVGIPIYLN